MTYREFARIHIDDFKLCLKSLYHNFINLTRSITVTFFEWFYKAIIIESIAVLLMLLMVLTLKYFFKSEFKKVQYFHQKYIMVDTDINEVLKDAI